MMPRDVREDAVGRELARLGRHDVDTARGERIRAQCHAALARHRRAPKLAAVFTGSFARRVLEPALVSAICLVYLTDVLRRALALYGF